MKATNLIFGFLVTGIIVSCSSSNKVASNSGDDIYYNPTARNNSGNVATTTSETTSAGYGEYVPNNQSSAEADYYNGTNNSNAGNSTDSKSGNGNTNYAPDPNYSADDYYDYEYASRIRRFHAPVYSNYYYDDVYTNSYWYDPFPYNVGLSIYSGGFYGNNWGWNNGWNNGGWNNGGWNNGWNNFGRNNWYNGYDPFWNNPYAWNNPFNNNFGGYNNGYWNGYYDGLYGGNYWNNPYCNGGYFNSFDANNTGTVYGHRGTLSASNTGVRGISKQNPRALASNNVTESQRAVNRAESIRNAQPAIAKPGARPIPTREIGSTRDNALTKPSKDINPSTVQPDRGRGEIKPNVVQPSKDYVVPNAGPTRPVIERPIEKPVPADLKDDYFRPTRENGNEVKEVPVYENRQQRTERENVKPSYDRSPSQPRESRPEYKQNNNSRPAPSQGSPRQERNSNSGGGGNRSTGRSPR